MPTIKNNGTDGTILQNPRYTLAKVLPTANQPLFGRGIDGDVTLSPGSYNINTTRLGSNSIHSRTVDSPVALVSAISGNVLTVTAQAGVIGDFYNNDYCVLINLQGSTSFHANTGNWELVKISAGGGTTSVTLGNISKSYGQTDNSNLTGQQVLLIRIPEYKNLTIGNSATLTASAWNGTWGGLCVYATSGSYNTQPGGSVVMDGNGYRGATSKSGQGEGYEGNFNVHSTAANGNGGGGGSVSGTNAQGGGGGYGTAGTNGLAGGGTGGTGGLTVGTPDLQSSLFLGGGGGAQGSSTPSSGSGGNGGGIILILAKTIFNLIASSGGNSPSGGASGGGASAAGAGGSIYLISESLSVSSVMAAGGTVTVTGFTTTGLGGVGRITARYLTSGDTYASATADGAGVFTNSSPAGYKGSL